MTKRRWTIFLLSNPVAAVALGWRLLGATAEVVHYNREEARRVR